MMILQSYVVTIPPLRPVASSDSFFPILKSDKIIAPPLKVLAIPSNRLKRLSKSNMTLPNSQNQTKPKAEKGGFFLGRKP